MQARARRARPTVRRPPPRPRQHLQPPRRPDRQPARPRRRAQPGALAPARRDLHPRVLHRGGVAVQPEHRRPPRPVVRAGRLGPLRHERARHRRGPSIQHRLPHRHRRRRRRGRRRRARTLPDPGRRRAGRLRPRAVRRPAPGDRRGQRERRRTCSTTSTTPSAVTSSSRSSACWPDSTTPGATRTPPRRCCAPSRPAATPRAFPPTPRRPSECWRRPWPRSPEAWRTPASSASSTTTAPSPTTPRTPPSTESPSASSCSARPTSSQFAVSPMIGPAATNKGLALFPRRIGGRFVALSRHDRETNAVAFSDSLLHWDRAVTIQTPDRPWEVIQLGNCGSPIETDEGWLVLTHGVGPDADLQHRRPAPRPRRSDRRSSERCPSRCSHPGERAGRLRPERRLHAAVRCCTARPSSCPTASPTRSIAIATVRLPDAASMPWLISRR